MTRWRSILRHTAVTIGAGVTYGRLAPYIESHGFALHNLASLPHISAVGGCATATHGSGIRNRNLSAACSALELVTANGQRLALSRAKNPDHFDGAVVALGALGIVTSLTLDVEPTYQVEQVVYQDLPFSELEHNLDAIFASGYSVSLFTDWQNHRATQVWIKRRVDLKKPYVWPQEFYNARRATQNLHPVTGHSAESCTEQLGIPGPWYERLPHFRMNFVPSSGKELQTEYLVPREHGYEAIRAVEQLRDRITPHLFVTELRTIESDSLWMSTAYQRPSLAIHFTWKPEWPAVQKILPLIEAKLAPFEPRPHWAKLFTLPPATLQSRYAKLCRFQRAATGARPGRQIPQCLPGVQPLQHLAFGISPVLGILQTRERVGALLSPTLLHLLQHQLRDQPLDRPAKTKDLLDQP